jgi:hypothetical protein
MHLKLAKSANMTFFHQNYFGVSKNAELHANTKFVEMGLKSPGKKLQAKTNRIWGFLGFCTSLFSMFFANNCILSPFKKFGIGIKFSFL